MLRIAGGPSQASRSRPFSSPSTRSCSALWIDRPLAFLDAQKVVWERQLSPAGPLGGLIAAVQHREVLDLVVTCVVIGLGVVAWRRIGAPYGLYVLASVALPLAVVFRQGRRFSPCSAS